MMMVHSASLMTKSSFWIIFFFFGNFTSSGTKSEVNDCFLCGMIQTEGPGALSGFQNTCQAENETVRKMERLRCPS